MGQIVQNVLIGVVGVLVLVLLVTERTTEERPNELTTEQPSDDVSNGRWKIIGGGPEGIFSWKMDTQTGEVWLCTSIARPPVCERVPDTRR